MRRARDQQRSRVYDFDNALDKGQPRIELDDARKLVAKVAKHYGLRAPLITDGRGRRRACGSAHVIKLPRWSRSTVIVLHEAAHFVHAWRRGSSAEAWHGPEFVAIYAALLIRFAACTPATLATTLNNRGIRFHSFTAADSVAYLERTLT